MTDKHRILIFEPDGDIREWIAAALACAGYYVWKTDTPLMAVAVIEEHRPDLVILDYNRHLKTNNPEFEALFNAMKHITQFWMLDETARHDLIRDVDGIDDMSAGIISKSELSEADRIKLREMTARYQRCE